MVKNIFLVTMAVFLVVLGVAVISNQPKKQLTEIMPTPTTIQTISVAPTAVDNRCLITVRGQKYDVTQYRNQHSGGDIFNCGTDMTAVFNGQHSDKQLVRMQRYLVR
ncbi:MAG: cytochrome b5 domain-containing protein [Candidatus Shapirobacteria bacterium]|jgi:cytochrome b involved in lipid metabolism